MISFYAVFHHLGAGKEKAGGFRVICTASYLSDHAQMSYD